MSKKKPKAKVNSSHQVIKDLADLLVTRLKAEGFTILRYDAYSTSSVYLKLDYGVSNSIRISDHTGKQHLAYRYNIGAEVTSQYQRLSKNKSYNMFFYPLAEVEQLITHILADRQEKLDKYGEDRYRSFMDKNLRENKDAKGFWADAKLQ